MMRQLRGLHPLRCRVRRPGRHRGPSTSVLLGAPGARREPRHRPRRTARRATSRPATCSGPTSGTARRRRGGAPIMDAGASSRSTIVIRRAPRPPRTGAGRARGAILDGFPRTRRQAEALDRALARRAGRVDRALYIEVPTEDLVGRFAGRVSARRTATYNLGSNPPRVPACATSTARSSSSREDDAEDTVRARMAQQLAAAQRGDRPLRRDGDADLGRRRPADRRGHADAPRGARAAGPTG